MTEKTEKARSITDAHASLDDAEVKHYEQMVYSSLNEQNEMVEDESQLHSPTLFQQKLGEKDNYQVDVIQEVPQSHQDSIMSSGNDKVVDKDSRYRHHNISSKQRIMIDLQQKMDQ